MKSQMTVEIRIDDDDAVRKMDELERRMFALADQYTRLSPDPSPLVIGASVVAVSTQKVSRRQLLGFWRQR